MKNKFRQRRHAQVAKNFPRHAKIFSSCYKNCFLQPRKPGLVPHLKSLTYGFELTSAGHGHDSTLTCASLQSLEIYTFSFKRRFHLTVTVCTQIPMHFLAHEDSQFNLLFWQNLCSNFLNSHAEYILVPDSNQFSLTYVLDQKIVQASVWHRKSEVQGDRGAIFSEPQPRLGAAALRAQTASRKDSSS